VTRSIRFRVALGVFVVLVSLVAAQNLYVLGRFERGFREETDDQLTAELTELRAVVASPVLAEWIASASEAHSETELFIEVRDANGALVARSANVPETGIPDGDADVRGGVGFWETAHPRSGSGARHIRVAEMRTGPWRLRVAFSLEQVQRWYWNLRGNLATSLLLIAAVGTLAAWWVAARALRPLAEVNARARSLGALPEGSLPRTGSGDEVDQLTEVLNDLLRRIREEVMRVRRLTADVGHALRTPLTVLRGNVELQLGQTDGAHTDALVGALEQVDELARMVNQLLLLEKLESAPLAGLKREPLDLHALARSMIEHLRVVAEERGVMLELRGSPVEIEGDASQLRQLLANLIDNALRHTPRGGRVSVETRANGARAELLVTDTGKGIDPSEIERVFERFYSAPGERGAGTGLGLPIARAIARAHGGDVGATATAGGALFGVDLPLRGTRAN
jgi:signal transduction histidine kinase